MSAIGQAEIQRELYIRSASACFQFGVKTSVFAQCSEIVILRCIPPFAVVERFQLSSFCRELIGHRVRVPGALKGRIAFVTRILSRDQVCSHQQIAGQVLIVSANAHVAIAGQMLQQAILVVIPCLHIIRNGVPVIIEKHVTQIGIIPGPQPLPVTGIHHVEVLVVSYQKFWSLL